MSSKEIILYHYSFSPYARRVVWYLNLRGIPYSECKQPPTLPRPDVAALGAVYRRIPVAAIGRDIYTDTRLILRKLEELFPDAPQIRATSPEHKAFERLLEYWTIDGGIFNRGSQLIPTDSPLMKDSKFTKDREDYSGRPWSKESVEKNRPEALVEIKGAFEFLETTILADGRDWVLKTSGPSLADIEAVWPFHWLKGLKGALPGDYISANQFPKVFAWIERFDQAVKIAATKLEKPKSLKGQEAVDQISKSHYAESESSVDADDPTGLKKRQEVEVWPIDSGSNHRDRGLLVGLSGKEIVIESKTKDGQTVRVHTPRHGFRIRGIGKGNLKL